MRFLASCEGAEVEEQKPQGCSGSQAGQEGWGRMGSYFWKGPEGDPGTSLRGFSMAESAGTLSTTW